MLTPGAKLGPHEILSLIGAGGMGEVYRARDTRLERIVAIKVLPAHLADNPELRERFEREAKTIASLNHPHICTLHDIGRQDGVDFLVMEYLEGETLAMRLLKGPLPLDQVLRYAIEISDALDKAHRKGVTHRDVKPGNIMLTKNGSKLLDFGLAKLKQEATPANTPFSQLPTLAHNPTVQGTLLGTMQYMSPEQVEGKNDELDGRTDIFAFGAVVYEMATGKKAFEGKSTASLISSILKDEPPPISSLQPMTPPQLDRLVKTCLAKEPEERWQAASDLCRELKWVAEGGSEAGIPAPVVARRKNRERLARAVAAIAIVIAVVALSVVAYFRRAPAEPQAVRFSIGPPEKTTFSISASFLTVSPDGTKLAFEAVDSSGKSQLWVRPLDSEAPQPLAGTDNATLPFWSADSRFLAFYADGKLKKIAIAGGPAQTLAEAATGFGNGSWNPEGVVLFTPAGSGGGIHRVSAAGGATTAITTLNTSRQETGHLWPHFLPDGNHFLYLAQSSNPENNAIWVGSLDEKDSKLLLAANSFVQYAPPGYLLFARERTLLAQPFDADALELTGEALPIAEEVQQNMGNGRAAFAVSQNGVLAYRSRGIVNTQLTWFDRTGKSLGQLGPPGSNDDPELSPDGKRLAVERQDAQGAWDIWLADLVRGTSTRFTFDPASDYLPLWSPDGSQLAFSSNRMGRIFNLYQKPSSGAGNEELLLQSEVNKYVMDGSSDGRFLIYSNQDPKTRHDLWVLPLSGDRKPFLFLQTQFEEYHARFSPDGRWTAYISNESGKYEVYVQSFPKPSGKWQVSTNGGIQPRWRRDGKELFYLGLDGKLMAVAVKSDATLEIGAPTALFEARTLYGTAVNISARQEYDVTGDGQRFLLNVDLSDDASNPITVVLNWTAGLQK